VKETKEGVLTDKTLGCNRKQTRISDKPNEAKQAWETIVTLAWDSRDGVKETEGTTAIAGKNESGIEPTPELHLPIQSQPCKAQRVFCE